MFVKMIEAFTCCSKINPVHWYSKINELFDYIPSDDGSQATVVIRGVGFSEENTTLQVRVKNMTCYVVMSNQTKVVCKMERLPLGVHQLTLLVRPYGFALNASTGEGIFLRVEPRLVAIEPPRASEIGRSECQMSSKGMSAFCVLLFTTCFFLLHFHYQGLHLIEENII